MPHTAWPPPRPGAFTPKIVSVLREGYGLQALRADALAGLTVAVLPRRWGRCWTVWRSAPTFMYWTSRR